VPIELKRGFCDKVSDWLKEAIIGKKFDKERLIEDKAGDFDYHFVAGAQSLKYIVFDTNLLTGEFMSGNKHSPLHDCSRSLLEYILDLEGFLLKHGGPQP
jgi:hypothetical protein